jgi:hypothetical protein
MAISYINDEDWGTLSFPTQKEWENIKRKIYELGKQAISFKEQKILEIIEDESFQN